MTTKPQGWNLAEIWEHNGRADKAAPLFEERGNNLEAARLFALAQRWDKAAALFVKSGYSLKASEAYEKQGDLMRAAETCERHFLENVTFSTSYSGGAPSSETKNALRAGVDSIELWNPSTNSADISHWWISDDFFTPQK